MEARRIRHTFFIPVAGLFALTCIALSLLFFFLLGSVKIESLPLLQKNILTKASNQLLENTQNKAEAYEAIFYRIEQTAIFLAQNITHDLVQADTSNVFSSADITLSFLPQNGMFTTSPDKQYALCYWGGASIDAATQQQLTILAHQADLFENAQKMHVGVRAVWFIGQSGSSLYYPNIDFFSHLPPANQHDFRTDSFYLDAKPSQDPHGGIRWLSSYIDPILQQPVVSVIMPVTNQDSSFFGVVGLDIILSDIMAHINRNVAENLKYDLILDTTGSILSLPDWLSLAWELPVIPTSGTMERDAFGPSLLHASNESVQQTAREILVQSSGSLQFDVNGIGYLTAFTRLKTTQWIVAETIPSKTALQPLLGMEKEFSKTEVWLSWVAPIALASLLFGLLVAFFKYFEYFFEKPLNFILKNINRVKDGYAPLEPSVQFQDKLGQLSSAIHHLAITLDKDRKQLKEARQEYRRIFEDLPVGVFRVTMKGDVLDVNPAMATLGGYESVSAFLASVKNMESLYLNPEERQKFIDAMGTQGRVDGEALIHLRRDGKAIPVIRTARLIEGDDGSSIIEGVVYDSSLRNRRLDAQKELARIEAASQAKNVFLATLSHELRTPLNALLGGVDILSDTCLSSKQTWTLNLMRESALMLVQFVDELLDYSRIEAGKVILKREIFDLHELIHSLLVHYADKARSKNIDIHFSNSPQVCDSRVGDPESIRKVLVSLLDNAFKFSARGSSICVQLDETPHASMVRMTVSDTGPGIPENQKKHIIEYFHHTDAQKSTPVRSPGVGLSLVRELVSLMGGWVSLESKEGYGTHVYVHIPLPSNCSPEATDEDIESLLNVHGRILVVDDYAFGRKMFGHYIEGSQIVMDTASSGEQAVTLASQNMYDLILMDWEMPGMSGVEAAQILRDREKQTECIATPCVVMISHEIESLMTEDVATLFNGHVEKPVSRKVFISILKQFLGKETPLSPAP